MSTELVLSIDEKTTIEQEVRAVIEEILAGIRSLDLDRIQRSSTDSFNMGYASGGYFFPSMGVLVNTFRPAFEKRLKHELTVKDMNIAVLCPTVAVVILQMDVDILEKDGSTFSGTEVLNYVVIKEASGWKAAHGNESVHQRVDTPS